MPLVCFHVPHLTRERERERERKRERKREREKAREGEEEGERDQHRRAYLVRVVKESGSANRV